MIKLRRSLTYILGIFAVGMICQGIYRLYLWGENALPPHLKNAPTGDQFDFIYMHLVGAGVNLFLLVACLWIGYTIWPKKKEKETEPQE